MSLVPGVRLGPHEILSPLGAGGMGEVYKARDTRLESHGRDQSAARRSLERSDLRARFEREARAIAALDHPHICAIHDVGEAKRRTSWRVRATMVRPRGPVSSRVVPFVTLAVTHGRTRAHASRNALIVARFRRGGMAGF